MANDPFTRLYGGLPQLGPGSDADTLAVLRSLPSGKRSVVVDAGCGNGRQTLVLARELAATVDAIDLHAPFLEELRERARGAGLDSSIRTHALDMADLSHFAPIDLLWSEGAAYSIGIQRALETWRPWLGPNGLLVISELCWLTDDPPAHTRKFFATEYPAMTTPEVILQLIEAAGFRLLSTHTLPRSAWIDGYYGPLEPRARDLRDDPDETTRTLARSTQEEIEVFRTDPGSYGYVFFVCALLDRGGG